MNQSASFKSLSFVPEIQRGIQDRRYLLPTEIQSLIIPAIQRGEDVLGLAPTGTGKTMAFVLPVINDLAINPARGISVLVLAPTAELSDQLAHEFQELGSRLKISTMSIVEDTLPKRIASQLRENPGILVGTPTEILNAAKKDLINLMNVRKVILDEVDSLIEGSLKDDVIDLLKELPANHERQTMLFTATLPANVERNIVDILPGGKIYDAQFEVPLENLKHITYEVMRDKKLSMLFRLLEDKETQSTIIFCHDAREALWLHRKLQQSRFNAGVITPEMSIFDRSRAMSGFRGDRFSILVSTGDIARGIDVTHVTDVIHYSIPVTLEEYRHRAGRAGRAGKLGRSTSLIEPYEMWDATVMFQSLKIEPVKGHAPPQLSSEARTEDIDYHPEFVIREIQNKLGYTFKRPGLLLSALNRNRHFEDPMETAVMLNLLGRPLYSLLLTDLAANSLPAPSIDKIKILRRRYESTKHYEKCAETLGLKPYVLPDRESKFGVRVSNLEQALFNTLGAMFLDCGSTDEIRFFFWRAAQEFWPKHLNHSFGTTARNEGVEPIGAETRLRVEEALGYQFKNTAWLDIAMRQYRRTGLVDDMLFSKGYAACPVAIVDILRRGGFDWPTKELRETRNRLCGMTEVWESAKGAELSYIMQETFGARVEIQGERAKALVLSLMGAVYSDGGVSPVSDFLLECLPDAAEWLTNAEYRMRRSADLQALQENLDTEGERMRARIEARKRDLQAAPKREVAEPTLQEDKPNYRNSLRLYVETESLGKLKFKPERNGDSSVHVRVLLNKQEIAIGSGANEELASEEAARLACQLLLPH